MSKGVFGGGEPSKSYPQLVTPERDQGEAREDQQSDTSGSDTADYRERGPAVQPQWASCH